MGSGEELRRQLAAEELRLERVEAERAEIHARMTALRHQLRDTAVETGSHSLPILPPEVPATAAEKVGLFRSLFRGREDVFPTRFLSRKDREAGLCARL